MYMYVCVCRTYVRTYSIQAYRVVSCSFLGQASQCKRLSSPRFHQLVVSGCASFFARTSSSHSVATLQVSSQMLGEMMRPFGMSLYDVSGSAAVSLLASRGQTSSSMRPAPVQQHRTRHLQLFVAVPSSVLGLLAGRSLMRCRQHASRRVASRQPLRPIAPGSAKCVTQRARRLTIEGDDFVLDGLGVCYSTLV